MINILAIVVAVLIASVLVYAATRPDTFRVQRAASINAPPERIFALIDDLHGWDAWSPYEKKDPLMKRAFSGAAHGKGAVYAWDGNREVGKGGDRDQVVNSAFPDHDEPGYDHANRGPQHC